MTKQPWDDVPNWDGPTPYFQFLRSGVRRIWSKHPIRISYVQEKRYKANLGRSTKKNPEGMVWAVTCEECGDTVRQSQAQVDHKVGGKGFSTFDEFLEWTRRMLWVTYEEIQILCKPCHEAKSYSERTGMSPKQAALEKKVIKKLKELSVSKQKEQLSQFGYSGWDTSNQDKRREIYRLLFKEGKIL